MSVTGDEGPSPGTLLNADWKGHALPHQDLGKADVVLDRHSLVQKVDALSQMFWDYYSTRGGPGVDWGCSETRRRV